MVLLEAAHRQRADVVIANEPWVNTDPSRPSTATHPAYQVVCPWQDWAEKKPRVLIYTRKDRPGLSAATNPQQPAHPDLISCTILQGSTVLANLEALYNAPPGCVRSGEAVDLLLAHPPRSSPLLWVGDFNLHHAKWDPLSTRRPNQQAKQLASFTDLQQLHLIQDESPTHSRGAVIDLAWASADLWSSGSATAEVADDLYAGGDHKTLRIEVLGGPTAGKVPVGRFRMGTTEREPFLQSLQEALPGLHRLAGAVECATPPGIKQALDALATGITDAIHTALVISTKRSSKEGRGYHWTPECATAAARARRARKSHPDALRQTQQVLRSAVSKAKKSFFTKLIDDSALDRSFFKATKWIKGQPAFASPSLVAEEGPAACSLEDKVSLLRQVHVPSARASQDVPFPSLQQDSCWDRVTVAEAQASLLSPGNTAPGIDEIPPNALKMAWPILCTPITILYDCALAWGHHPSPFKRATLCTLQKPGKRDRASPRAYRLIALLSTLGKGLERLIARRLASAAVCKGVIPPGYHGAVPLRSATDLVVSLTDDIERTFGLGKVASLLTFDIRGAFDSVLPGRLACRLVEQGWAHNLVKWVTSFQENREAAISLEGHTSPVLPVAPALPQGSPVSPILFMLFMQPLFSQPPPADTLRRAGYADDGRLIAASNSLDQNIITLQRELAQVGAWCKENGLSLDLAKTELIHFSRRRNTDNPCLQLPPSLGPGEISPVGVNKPLRWLGVLFTRKLQWLPHVRMAAHKAMAAAGALKLLGGCLHGAPAYALRQATLACVVSTATYAAEAWWPHPTAPNRAGLSSEVDRPLRAALRVTLPVWRTTPIPLLHHGAGIPPAAILLDHITRKAAIRLHRLDKNHILKIGLRLPGNIAGRTLRLTRLASLVPFAFEQVNPLLKAVRHGPLGPPPMPAIGRTKEQQSYSFQLWEATREASDIWVFSDGSKTSHGTGGGWIVKQQGRVLAAGRENYGPHVEVFDAEARALASGTEAVAALPAARLAGNLWACLDNKAVADMVYGEPSGSSQRPILRTRKVLAKWATRNEGPLQPSMTPAGSPSSAAAAPGCAHVLWIPGHAGILGNTQADMLAGLASRLPPPEAPLASLAGAQRWARITLAADTRCWWESLKRSARFSLAPASPSLPKELRLRRSHLATLLAERSGHGDFAEYHDRFDHPDARRECQAGCRAPTAAGHFLLCPRAHNPALLRAVNGRVVRRHEVLTSVLGAQALSQWLAAKPSPV